MSFLRKMKRFGKRTLMGALEVQRKIAGVGMAVAPILSSIPNPITQAAGRTLAIAAPIVRDGYGAIERSLM